MNEEQKNIILHRLKNLAQVMLSLQSQLDKLAEEVHNGMDCDTISDCIGNDRWTDVQGKSEVRHPDSVADVWFKEEEIQDDGFSPTSTVS